MKSAAFEYVRAESVAEACDALQREGEGARVIAGGQSLVPMMAMRLLRPALLVDINEIAELKRIEPQGKSVRVGACVRQADLERDQAFAGRIPLIRQALAWVGHVQTRNRGTIGGSLAHADPSAELPLVARVLGATLTARSRRGARDIAADAFFVGPMTTAIEPGECLESVRFIPWSERRTGCSFTEISNRHGDFAMVAACAQVALDGGGRCTRAAFGLGGVAGVPLAFPQLAERLVGTRLEEEAVKEVAQQAARQTDPGTDLFATADYRRHLAGVLAARAIRAAHEQARSLR